MALEGRFCATFYLTSLLLISAGLSCSALYTFVVWDFDSHDGMTIVPKYNDDVKFRADLSPLGSNISSILIPGIMNRSVHVNGKSFNLATGLGFTCLRDIDACGESAWNIEFWLKVEDWNVTGDPVIMRTTNSERTDPGIYIGKADQTDKVLVYMRGSSGKTLWRTFSQDLVWKKWAYVYILTNNKNYMTLIVNRDVQSGRLAKDTLETTPKTPANFVVGAENGPNFYLDFVRIRYPGAKVESTTTSTTTSSTNSPTTLSPTTKEETTTSQPPTTEKIISTLSTTPVSTEASTTGTPPPQPTQGSLNATLVSTGKPSAGISNIWIPILIGVLALLLFAIFVIWIFCCRRRNRSSRHVSRNGGVELADRSGNYVRASTIVPYHDESPHVDTDDNNTDREAPLLENTRRQ